MNASEALDRLRSMSNPRNVEEMARFGISDVNTLGVPMPEIRRLAKQMGKEHHTALELWRSRVHEARILACLVEDPGQVTEEQLDSWVEEIDSWDVCDQFCSNLVDRTRFAYAKAAECSKREEEFVKRAAFSLMAALAVHDKTASDEQFLRFLPLIERESSDERNFVKKSVNWALRQIGKRSIGLNRAATKSAKRVARMKSKSARWIASDALRELSDERVLARLETKARG